MLRVGNIVVTNEENIYIGSVLQGTRAKTTTNRARKKKDVEMMKTCHDIVIG